ncbi:MAG TPA: TolC family protein, partial [Armatimonadota bacterium]
IAEVSFQEGKIAKYDLLRNQTVLADAEQQLATAQRDARIAVVDLISVLGVGPTSDFLLTDTLEYAPVLGTQESYMAEAVKARPELTAAREKVNSAQASVGVAKSAYQPQIYANAMEGVTAVSGGTDTGLTVGVTIGLPIFDGGLRRSSVREAESMLEAVKQDEQQALLGVQRDVNTVWAEIQSSEKVVQLSGAAVSQAEEDYRVIRLRYESGKAVNVEVLDALSSLVRAQNNRLVALYEHNIARDRLARAVGEL